MINEAKTTLVYVGARKNGKDRIVSTETYLDDRNKAMTSHSAEVAKLRDLVRNWMSTGSSSVFEFKFNTRYGKMYAIELSSGVHVIMFVTASHAGGHLYTFSRLITNYQEYTRFLDNLRKFRS